MRRSEPRPPKNAAAARNALPLLRWTPLCFAAQAGHAALVGALVAHGADVNVTARHGKTARPPGAPPPPSFILKETAARAPQACYIAAEQGRAPALAALLEAQCEKDAPDDFGMTPLIAAVQNNCAAAVAALVAGRCDVNRATPDAGESPAYIAAYLGHADILAVLISAGANVESPNADGYTPETIARENGHEDCFALLCVRKQISQSRMRRGFKDIAFLVCGRN